MLIKTTILSAAVALGLAGTAFADGAYRVTLLDDQALDGVVAGTAVLIVATGEYVSAFGVTDARGNFINNKLPVPAPIVFDEGG